MYKFIMEDFGKHELVSKVIINGETLDAEHGVFGEDDIGIKCLLKNIDKYIFENDFPEDIVFVMEDEDIRFKSKYRDIKFDSKYINFIFLRKKNNGFCLNIWLNIDFIDWEGKWSLNYFFDVYKIVFEKEIKYSLYGIDLYEDDTSCGLEIEVCFNELISANEQINKCLDTISTTLYKAMDTMNRDKFTMNYYYTIPVPIQIHTALKQYLIYFSEFVKRTKGKDMSVEVTSEGENIDIRIPISENLEEINMYLEEYCGFIKQNIDSIVPNVEVYMTRTEMSFFMIDLQHQLRNLETSIKMRMAQDNSLIDYKVYLERTVDKLINVLLEDKKNPQPISLQMESNSIAMSSSSSNINFNFKLELVDLQREILNLKEALSDASNHSIKEELDKIDDSLMEMEANPNEIKNNKSVFRRIARIIEKIDDSESNLNKTVRASKTGIDAIKNVARTYNKFAEWLGLPQVPSVFLETSN